MSNINGSQLVWRLEKLQEFFDEEMLKPRPNKVFCMTLFEQMAKESGGHYRKVKTTTDPPLPPLSDHQKVELIVRTMAHVVKRQPTEDGASPLKASLPAPV